MARFNLIIKYAFFVVLVLGAGVAIERYTRIKYLKLGDSLALHNVVYNASSDLEFEDFQTVLRKHYLKCFTNPSKPFCLISAHKRLEIFQENQSHNAEVVESKMKNMTAAIRPHRFRIRSLLAVFNKLMDDYNVKIMMVEPSILFCLLSDEKTNGMLLKGFNPSHLLGSRNIVTVGILSEDSEKLEGTNLTMDALSVGFKVLKFRRYIVRDTDKSFETVHYIFMLQDIAVHVVVFYPQETYWWHAGIDAQRSVQENLLFVEDGIFEKVFLFPLNLDAISMNGIFLPHDIRYFMLQIRSSKFVQCNGNTSTNSFDGLRHPSLSMEELNNRAEVALKELKAIFAPQLALFWIWSSSLLGWSSKCDIFHYSTVLELAVTHKSISGLDLDALIANNDNLEVSNHTESKTDFEYRIFCHGLEINLSILQEDLNLLIMERNDGLNVTYPKFTLCATSLYNLKTQVPCFPEEILQVEEKTDDSKSLNATLLTS